MRKQHQIALLLCAASLLTASVQPRLLVAGDTNEVFSTPSSQAAHADSISPAPVAQPSAAQYQLDQDTTGPEPQGAQEYMDASEQISRLYMSLIMVRQSRASFSASSIP